MGLKAVSVRKKSAYTKYKYRQSFFKEWGLWLPYFSNGLILHRSQPNAINFRAEKIIFSLWRLQTNSCKSFPLTLTSGLLGLFLWSEWSLKKDCIFPSLGCFCPLLILLYQLGLYFAKPSSLSDLFTFSQFKSSFIIYPALLNHYVLQPQSFPCSCPVLNSFFSPLLVISYISSDLPCRLAPPFHSALFFFQFSSLYPPCLLILSILSYFLALCWNNDTDCLSLTQKRRELEKQLHVFMHTDIGKEWKAKQGAHALFAGVNTLPEALAGGNESFHLWDIECAFMYYSPLLYCLCDCVYAHSVVHV